MLLRVACARCATPVLGLRWTPPECTRRTACYRGIGEHSKREPHDVRISGTPGRAGALRTNVRTRPGAPGGVTGPLDERARAGRPAWRLLHQPAQSGGSGAVPAPHHPETCART